MRLHFDLQAKRQSGHFQIHFFLLSFQMANISLEKKASTISPPPISSPALAAQDHDDQAISSDAQGEDESIDHRQEDPLKLISGHVLHITGLLQIRSQVPRTGTRACIIVVVVHKDMLETDER